MHDITIGTELRAELEFIEGNGAASKQAQKWQNSEKTKLQIFEKNVHCKLSSAFARIVFINRSRSQSEFMKPSIPLNSRGMANANASRPNNSKKKKKEITNTEKRDNCGS